MTARGIRDYDAGAKDRRRLRSREMGLLMDLGYLEVRVWLKPERYGSVTSEELEEILSRWANELFERRKR